MSWAKVDDGLYSSMKWRRASKSARALWTSALSWSMDQLTDGHVPREVLGLLDGTRAEAASLVTAGLWDVVDGGWRFHDWHDYQPDAASIRAKREAESVAGAEGNHIRWHVKRNVVVTTCVYCRASGTRSGGDRVPDGGPDSGANPPVPVPVPNPDLGSPLAVEDGSPKTKNVTHATRETRDVLALDDRRRKDAS